MAARPDANSHSADAAAIAQLILRIMRMVKSEYGMSNREIADRLIVNVATVQAHLSRIYTKLGVDTRAGAVAKAIDLRIIRT